MPPRAEVVVVGAGVAGLSTAYHLLRAGKSVVVLERGALGRGETARSTAHLASALDDRFYELERMHGARGARLAAESHAAAIDSIEVICTREQIACDFERVDGYLFGSGAEALDELLEEYEAAKRAGLPVERVGKAPLPFDTGPCLRFAQQAQIDPAKYLLGLARAVEKNGGIICTNSTVEKVEEGKDVLVRIRGGQTISAGSLVVTTNSPVNDLFAMHTKQAPYRTYVIACEIEPGSVTRALYWDTEDPYHYIRLKDDHTLIVGGEDHKSGQARQPEERWQRLEGWTRARFPVRNVQARWSGQIQEPADGLAFIGRNPGSGENVFIATGDSGNGMTHGALAGLILTDLICGGPNAWVSLYQPSRTIFTLPSARELVKENVNVAVQYGDWLRPGKNASELPPRGQGAVVRKGVHKIAIFVDDEGNQHQYSASCTHLGCVVAWNRAERSWDCPCHGSRYDAYGHVLTGPASADLTPVAERPAEIAPSREPPSREPPS